MPFETDLNIQLKPSKVYTPADWFSQGKFVFVVVFLNASSKLYMRPCPCVRPYIGQSIDM